MWHYSLLGTPLFGLILFFVLTFEPAFFLYLGLVLLAFAVYYQISERGSNPL